MRKHIFFALALVTASAFLHGSAAAEENTSQWIWTGEKGLQNAGERCFRRVFVLGRFPQKATLTITCDNQYEVYINGKLAGAGNEWQVPGIYNISQMLLRGSNTITVKGNKEAAGPAGLLVDLDCGNDLHLVSDANWTWYPIEVQGWMQPNFPAAGWKLSEPLGRAEVAPWNLKGWPKNLARSDDDAAAGKGNFVNGFRVPEGFVVDQFAGENDTSSVLCMCFNGKGQLLTAAAGNGPTEIRMLDTLNGYLTGHHIFYQGLHCQGMCAVGSDIYAIGNGKLYLLEDKLGQGHADTQEALCPEVLGSMSEHGPHAIVHGPDGHFYIMLGNDSSFSMQHLADTSPIRDDNLYWGNLLPIQSSNFMDGKGPPGGRILRADMKGKEWEVIAHGFRNDYDFAFASSGEIFGFDSDMEWDIGLPWYRANRTVHIPIGANFGWRYGSGKWKNHLPDSIPPMNEVGRGSPTGVESYNHVAYPEEYRDAIFLCDWSRARILVMNPKRNGATWKAEPKEFLAVRGVNFPVTDACVGPDGALYFAWGGRGAKGGVIRVRYVGPNAMRSVFKEAELRNIPGLVAAALNTPQPQSAYGRAAIERQKQAAGPDWTWQLAAVARDPNRSDALRSRALDCLGMDADVIDPVLLSDLAKDPSAFVRAQAVERMATNGDPSSHAMFKNLLADEDPWVLRRACEGLLRYPDPQAAGNLTTLLAYRDRFVRYAARQALLRLPTDLWSQAAITLKSPLGKAEGLLSWAESFQALAIDPQKIEPHFEPMLGFGATLLEAPLAPDETLTALRAVSLMLLAHTGQPLGMLAPNSLPQAQSRRPILSPEMKARLVGRCIELLKHDDTRICMDAAEILGFIGDAKAIAPLLEKVKMELLPRDQRIHYATAVTNISEGWTAQPAGELLEFLSMPGPGENGLSFAANLAQCSARLSRNLPANQRAEAFNGLTPGAKTSAASGQGFDELSLNTIVAEYQKARNLDTRKLLLGKIASIGDDEAFHALEKLVDETSPVYDTQLTLLMRFKHVEAKKFAVRALTSASRGLAGDALARITELFKEDPEDQNLYYGLIVCAARSNESRIAALDLLKKWPVDDKAIKDLPAQPDAQIGFWEQVYKKNYPADKREFPEFTSGEGYQDPTKFELLQTYLKVAVSDKSADPQAGKALFSNSAKCINCHVFKGAGKQIGPELTDVAKRFDRNKILEDIIYPSKVVDARYTQVLFKTKDGQRISGFVSAETDDTISVTNGDAVSVILKNQTSPQRPPPINRSCPTAFSTPSPPNKSATS